jgi:hypothetical protein
LYCLISISAFYVFSLAKRQGKCKIEKTRQESGRQTEDKKSIPREDKTRPEKKRQEKTRQNKARQDRQGKTTYSTTQHNARQDYNTDKITTQHNTRKGKTIHDSRYVLPCHGRHGSDDSGGDGHDCQGQRTRQEQPQVVGKGKD